MYIFIYLLIYLFCVVLGGTQSLAHEAGSLLPNYIPALYF
jgi:hypothetical protein